MQVSLASWNLEAAKVYNIWMHLYVDHVNLTVR